MNHTPGPWKNRTMGDDADENGGQVFSGKLHLATAHYGNGIDCSEKSANAALIAAAPELLQACITALHVLDVCKCDDMAKLAGNGIRAAIAKATSP